MKMLSFTHLTSQVLNSESWHNLHGWIQWKEVDVSSFVPLKTWTPPSLYNGPLLALK